MFVKTVSKWRRLFAGTGGFVVRSVPALGGASAAASAAPGATSSSASSAAGASRRLRERHRFGFAAGAAPSGSAQPLVSRSSIGFQKSMTSLESGDICQLFWHHITKDICFFVSLVSNGLETNHEAAFSIRGRE